MAETLDPEDRKKTELHNVLSRNAFATLLANLLYFFIRVGIPPFVLHYVSLEEYGLWSYSFLIIGYVSMGAFGIMNVYIRFGALYAAQNKWGEINKLYSTGVVTSLLIFGIALIVCWFGLPYLFPYFHIPTNLQQTALILMYGTLVIFCVDLTFGVYIGYVQSLQQLGIERAIVSTSYVIETLLIFTLLWMGVGIESLLIAYAVRVLLVVILARWQLFRLMPSLDFSFGFIDWAVAKLFWNYGGIVQLSGIIGNFNRTVERLLSGLTMGASATAIYDLGTKFPSTALLIPGSINAIFLPTVAHLCAEDRYDEIRQIYIKGSRLINLVTGGMMAFLTAFAWLIVLAWLGPKPYIDTVTQIVMLFAVTYQLEVVTGPASAIFRGINHPKKELVFGGGRLFLLAITVPTAFYIWGYSFAVINSAVVASTITASFCYLLMCNEVFKVGHWLFLKEVIIPGFIPYTLAFGLAWFVSPWLHSLGVERLKLIPALLVMLFIYLGGAFFVLFTCVMSSAERRMLREQLKRLRGLNRNK